MSWFLLRHLDGVIFDHQIGQQALAHGVDVGPGLGGVGFGQIDFQKLALADAIDPLKSQISEGVGDGFALGV